MLYRTLDNDSNALDQLIREYFAQYQPLGNTERFWVARLVQAEWQKRDLEKRWNHYANERERCLREFETLRARRTKPATSRGIHLVPARRR